MVCILGMSTAASAFSTSAVVLFHDGKATTYETEQINDAMEAAQDGDLVMLNEGTYPSFTIKKKITVKGAGERTYINGDVNISIPDTPILTDNLLEFVYVDGSVIVSNPIKKLCIRQCTMKNIYFNANTYESLIDRSFISKVLYADNTNIKSLTLTNCLIQEVRGLKQYGILGGPKLINQNTTFINCLIQDLGYCGGTVINSIINDSMTSEGAYGTRTEVDNTIFVNSYYDTTPGTSNNNTIGQGSFSSFSNCYTGEDPLSYDTDIASLGYFGNDGTIIGPLGGSTPYTLVPNVPKVTESMMMVDSENKQLKIFLTVSPK